MSLDYDDLQARALSDIDDALAAGMNGRPAAEASLAAKAQIEAILAVGAAMQDLAQAVRERR